MKKFLTTCLSFSLLFTFKVNAQDYNPLVNGNTSLFQSDEIVALHVDSMHADLKGTAYYFLKSFGLKDPNEYCLDFKPAWSGSKMVSDGTTSYFFNKNEDTLKILPLNDINVPWVFYKYSNGDYIDAQITLKEQQTFLGLTDSVKTISLQRKTAANVNVTDNVNNVTLQISKRYGFIKMISFSTLPDSYTSYELLGMTSPQTGLQLLTSHEIYDFDLNDEFHYKTDYFNVPISGYSDKIIRKVIGKYTSANTDTVVYTFQQYKERINYTVINDGRETVASAPVYEVTTFDQQYIVSDTVIYPGIYLMDNTDGTYGTPTDYQFSVSLSDGGKRELSIDHMQGVHYDENSACWINVVDGPGDYTSYMEGCGYTYINRDVYPSSDNSKLVYYKKGADAHGQALVLSTLIQTTSPAFTLYPNPIKQEEDLHFNAANFNVQQVIIYSSTGSKVLESFDSHAPLQFIGISKLEPGLYIVQLINESNSNLTAKLIIR